MLEKYNEVLPGAAERILAMAERQSAHRQGLEKTVIGGHVKSERLGSILGFILSLTVIIGGFSLIYNGMATSGSVIVISDLVALAGAYAYGRRMQKQERIEKMKLSS